MLRTHKCQCTFAITCLLGASCNVSESEARRLPSTSKQYSTNCRKTWSMGVKGKTLKMLNSLFAQRKMNVAIGVQFCQSHTML